MNPTGAYPGSGEGGLFTVVKTDDRISLSALLRMPVTDEPHLLVPILPQSGIALVAGKPDCGKSMFARCFALHVAMKKERFLDYSLATRSGRVIYVATEDGVKTTSSVIQKQWAGMIQDDPDCPEPHIDFLFDKGDGPEMMLLRLSTLLDEGPCDLVVLDSYGDLFPGKDANSNSEVRKALAPFHGLATKHQTLMLFLTHLTKTGYAATPDQMHVAGGAALVQKARTVLQLVVEDGNGFRLLCITKGNGVPSSVKSNALRLFFDENTLVYESTGELVPIAAVGKTAACQVQIDWYEVYGSDVVLTTRELERRLEKMYSFRPRRARYYISEQLYKVKYGHYTYDADQVDTLSSKAPSDGEGLAEGFGEAVAHYLQTQAGETPVEVS